MASRIKNIEPATPPPDGWVVLKKGESTQTVHPDAVAYWVDKRKWERVVEAPATVPATDKEG